MKKVSKKKLDLSSTVVRQLEQKKLGEVVAAGCATRATGQCSDKCYKIGT